MKKPFILLGGAAVLGAALIAGFGTASGADHGDAPLAKANHQLDLADVYAFDGGAGNVALAFTVNPLTMPGDKPTFGTTQHGDLYQIKIDSNGDAVPDVSYNVSFGEPNSDGAQSVSVRRARGAQADTLSAGGDVVAEGSTTSPGTGAPVINSASSGTKLFAGLRDDPFFFDLNAFKAGLKFRDPGTNFFAGLNVSGVVLSIAAEDFMAPAQGAAKHTAAAVWVVTSANGTVIDRMGRPAINTVFIPKELKDKFNQTKPADDLAQWKSTVVASLNGLGSDPALADALLPDILTFDTSKPWGFLNGRQLTDDVIDGELQLVTGSKAASDFVSNDSAFLGGFPYLGAPNTEPLPPTTEAAAPAPAPVAPKPAAPAVKAPNTGTGDGSGSDNNMLIWLVLGVAGVAAVSMGATVAVRGRK